MATKRAGVRTSRVAVRALACLAVIPVGLGPSMIAFAQADTSTDPATTETAAPTTAAATIPTTAATTTTTTVSTTAPSPTIGTPTSTDATTATSTTVESAVTTQVATTGASPTTTGDPSTGTTVEPPLPTAPTSNPSAPSSTVAADPTAGSAATMPSTTVPISALPISTVEPATTVPESTTTVPGPSLLNIVVPPPTETVWTLGLEYIGGTTYTGPYQLYLRNFIAGTTVSLRDGEVSGPLVRALGADYPVRVEMGSSYDPAFPFRWECTGSDSGLQTATTEQFTPTVSDFDATMDCVFIIDNTNPPTIDIVTEVEGDPAGDVSFDYDVRYNFFGDWPIGGHAGGDGTTATYAGLAGFRIEITATPIGATPATTETVIECRDAGGGFITSSTTTVSLSPANGTTSTCTATHTVPATLTIVEDVVPDDPTAPAASYSTGSRVVTGPTTWTLADGESESFVFPTSSFTAPRFTRNEVPGWDLTRVECLEDLGGGATAPYTDFTTSLGPTQGSASFPLPPPGTDLICRFVAEPAGPPSLDLDVSVNAIDLSAYADIDVEVRDVGGALVDTITVAPTGGGQNLLLDTGASSFTLEVLDDQGLSVDWNCGGTTSSTDTITFATILGETTSCTLELAEPFPTGAGSILLTKDEDPDNGEGFDITVKLGDFVVGAGRITEGGPGLSIPAVADGVYTVIEEGRFTDYQLTAVDCTNGTPSSITRTIIPGGEDTSPVRRGEFTLDTRAPGSADVSCTLTNTPSTDPAIIRIETVSEPGGADTFDYSIDPAGSVTTGTATFTQGDGDSASRGVEAGTFFTIAQNDDPGFATTVSCFLTAGGTPDLQPGLEGYVFAEPGVDYTCRFVNTAIAVPTATLELVTEVEPDTGVTFSYDLTPPAEILAPSPTTVDQIDGDTATLTTTAGSAITITHTSPFGYDTTSACVDGPTTISTGAATITYTPADASSVRCTFTHRRLPSLTIIESVTPDGLGAPAAEFSVGPAGNLAAGPSSFVLADDQQQTLLLDAGTTTTVNRDGPVELTPLGPVVCVETLPGGGVVAYTPTFAADGFVTVTADYGDAISCSFRSVPSPPPTALVNVVSSAGFGIVDDFTYAVEPVASVIGPTAFVNATDETTSFDVRVGGDITITQALPTGAYVTTVECSDDVGTVLWTGDEAVVISPGAAETITCVFDNQPLPPSVVVRTVTDPAVPPATTLFDYVVEPVGSILSGTAPFAQGNDEETTFVFDPAVVFGPTPPTITQAADAGYATRVGCFDPITETEPAIWISGLTIQPAPSAGQTLACVFENTAVAPVSYEISIDVAVDTGVVDVGDRYSFFTQVSGPGVEGDAGTGTDRTCSCSATTPSPST